MSRELKVKSVRALDRGLSILEAIRTHGPSTLREIHQLTGLDRATILRAALTLEQRSWLEFSPADGRYHPGHKLLGVAKSRDRVIAELAEPVLESLLCTTHLPADVAVRGGTQMLIVTSSRAASPFPISRNPRGRRPCMLRSALGRAYLAFCPESERRELMRALRASEDPDDRIAGVEGWVNNVLLQSRRQGFGVREDGYWAALEDYGVEVNAIAVPVTIGRRVVACINLMCASRSQTVAELASSHLDSLQTAARSLSAAIATEYARKQSQEALPASGLSN